MKPNGRTAKERSALGNRHYDLCYFLNYNTYNDLNLYEVGTQKCPPSYSFGPIVREHYVLHYVYEGRGTLHLNKQVYPVAPCEVFVLPPNVTTFYQADGTDPWNYIWIHFDGTKAVEFLRKAGISTTQPVLHLQDPSGLKKHMEEILNHNGDELFCMGTLYLFFQELISNSSRQVANKLEDPRLKYIKAIRDYIALKYYEPIRVQDFADLCGLERSYLTRMFKNATGHSPQEYLLSYRMKMAKHLLNDPNLTIEYIANSVGYADPFSFSKSFKNYTGVSPRQYRRLSQQGIELPDQRGL